MGKRMAIKKRVRGFLSAQRCFLVTIVTLFFLLCSGASAFEIPTGNEDIDLRWDNTFKYNLGFRAKPQNDAFLNNPNTDDGDRNFKNGGIMMNRIDILSELDIQYKKSYGARISGAGWYDQRYHDALDNNSVATSNHRENGAPALGLSEYTKKYFAGPTAELLDTFVFGKFDLGPVPLNLKVGRHTIYWGESLTFSGALHGISYSQMPVDTIKAYGVPGSDLKELFRPLNNISAQASVTNNLSIAAQYFLEWEHYILPEAGSYFGFSDGSFYGGESLIVGPLRYIHSADSQPTGRRDWGVAARWSPTWLDGTVGAYYRRFSDRLPQVQMNPVAREYFLVYSDAIDLYGLSFSKQIFGVSVGSELSYRVNMPLSSDTVVSTTRPAEGDTFGARGNTWHGLINFVGLVTPPLCSLASWSMEVFWSRWDNVTQGENLFKGRVGYNALDAVTKDFVGIGVAFTPVWLQVFPGMDLSMPLTYGTGLNGTSAVMLGGNERAGQWSAGISLDVRNKYKFDLKYVDIFGVYQNTATGVVSTYNTPLALLSDRSMVTFTAKVTF
jgi:hypothetical protein